MRYAIITLALAGVLLIAYGLTHKSLKNLNEVAPTSSLSISNESLGNKFKRAANQFTEKFNRALSQEDAPQDYLLVENTLPEAKRYLYLKYCMDKVDQPCADFDQSSMKNYLEDLITTQDLEIKSLFQYLRENPSIRSKDYEYFARQLLEDSNADIVMDALNVMDLFQPNSENLKAIIAPLQVSVEPELLERGLEVLAAYKELPEYNFEVMRLLRYQFRHSLDERSALPASHALYQNMNNENYNQFKDLSKKMAEDFGDRKDSSLNYRLSLLNSVLREYEQTHADVN
jgi:hypothetical protein